MTQRPCEDKEGIDLRSMKDCHAITKETNTQNGNNNQGICLTNRFGNITSDGEVPTDLN